MEHQYDVVEAKNQDVGNNYANQDIVSLFGWATSGYQHGAIAYQPWNTSNNNGDYYTTNALTGQADWGYNKIINGGNQENIGWRTLTKDEWYHLFMGRTMQNNGPRYTKGKEVADMLGVIIYPDNYNGSEVSSDLSATDWAAF